jgi:hypothetical protein
VPVQAVAASGDAAAEAAAKDEQVLVHIVVSYSHMYDMKLVRRCRTLKYTSRIICKMESVSLA